MPNWWYSSRFSLVCSSSEVEQIRTNRSVYENDCLSIMWKWIFRLIQCNKIYCPFSVAMDVKPAISADSVSLTIPEISSLTTTTLTSCSTKSSSNISTYNNGKTALTSDATLCGLCFEPIYDQYIMRVVDTYYHERCLQCCSCSKRLMHSCFARNGKLYCRIDYER